MTIPPAAAETLFHIGPLAVTNSLINGWIAVVFFVIVAGLLASRKNLVPRGIQNFAESVVDLLLAQIQKTTGNREQAVRFFPIVASLFCLILFSNWLGLLPGIGPVGLWLPHKGELELIPLFRSLASDLNFTLAIAVVAVVSSHIYGIKSLGVVSHVSKFFNIRGIIRAIPKGPTAIMVAVIEFGVGLIEIVGEIAKVLSLSLRLFGNVFAGEVLMTVMLGLFAYFLPLPFIALELLVGVVQATVFSLLTLAYLVVATQSHDEDHDAEHIEHAKHEAVKAQLQA